MIRSGGIWGFRLNTFALWERISKMFPRKDWSLTWHASAANSTHKRIKSESITFPIKIGRIKSRTACRYVACTRSGFCWGKHLESCFRGACCFHWSSSERSLSTSLNEGVWACGPVEFVLKLCQLYTQQCLGGSHSIFDLIRYTCKWCKAAVIWFKD